MFLIKQNFMLQIRRVFNQMLRAASLVKMQKTQGHQRNVQQQMPTVVTTMLETRATRH